MTDPFENMNRRIFAFNTQFDRYLLNPTLDIYQALTPDPIRIGASNFLRNIKSPVTFANALLQGDLQAAGDTLFATVVNTSVGFGGILDIAAHEGYGYKNKDFGQTLAIWGVPHGPYTVIPILGPASLRDGTSRAVDMLLDPVRIYHTTIDKDHLNYTQAGVSYLNARANLQDVVVELERSALDYYATMRSTYYQIRQNGTLKTGETSYIMDDEAFDFPDDDDL